MPEYRTDYTRVHYLEDCVGKTVAAASDRGDDFALRFGDGTYYFAAVYDDENGAGIDRCVPGPEAALALGVIDGAEYDRVRAELDADAAAKVAAHDAREYARLKAVFEPSPAPETKGGNP